jgi:hypothetical protein
MVLGTYIFLNIEKPVGLSLSVFYHVYFILVRGFFPELGFFLYMNLKSNRRQLCKGRVIFFSFWFCTC